MSDTIFSAMVACVLVQLVLVLAVLRLHREEVLILEKQIEMLRRALKDRGFPPPA